MRGTQAGNGSMSDEAAVLFMNQAFYEAFSEHDIGAMDAIWSRQDPVSCIHPGWGTLAGRDAVMESWAAILSGPRAPAINCRSPSAFVFGRIAYVICYEELESIFMVATNVFAREDASWKLIHHHAGVAPRPRSASATKPSAPHQ
jgi:ketosteroid isomerase-like protein